MASETPKMESPIRLDGRAGTAVPIDAESAFKDLMWDVIELSKDPVCILDCRNGTITRANPAAEVLLGYSGCEWETLSLSDLIPPIDDLEQLPDKEFVETLMRHRDGRMIPVHCCTVGSLTNPLIAAVFRPRDSVESMSEAERDPLTGLPNRTVFERRLKRALERREGDFAILFLDLDDFKVVNDSYGHPAGDQVLRQVAERLVQCLRPVDTIARYGGDEFVILLEGLDTEESAKRAAGRLLRTIGDPISVEGNSIRVTASIGIVPGGLQIGETNDAIRLADRAMYRAKALGRRCYVVFDERECPPLQAAHPKKRSLSDDG